MDSVSVPLRLIREGGQLRERIVRADDGATIHTVYWKNKQGREDILVENVLLNMEWLNRKRDEQRMMRDVFAEPDTPEAFYLKERHG